MTSVAPLVAYIVSGTHPSSGFYGVSCDTREAANAKATIFRTLGFAGVTVEYSTVPKPMIVNKADRRRDSISLAKLIGDIATGQVADVTPDGGKNTAAVERGKKRPSWGGAGRAVVLSAQERQAKARKAAAAKWRPSAVSKTGVSVATGKKEHQ